MTDVLSGGRRADLVCTCPLIICRMNWLNDIIKGMSCLLRFPQSLDTWDISIGFLVQWTQGNKQKNHNLLENYFQVCACQLKGRWQNKLWFLLYNYGWNKRRLFSHKHVHWGHASVLGTLTSDTPVCFHVSAFVPEKCVANVNKYCYAFLKMIRF